MRGWFKDISFAPGVLWDSSALTAFEDAMTVSAKMQQTDDLIWACTDVQYSLYLPLSHGARAKYNVHTWCVNGCCLARLEIRKSNEMFHNPRLQPVTAGECWEVGLGGGFQEPAVYY